MVQQSMSAESTPILSGAIPAFETFMTKWEQLAKQHAKLEPIIEPGLNWAYKYYNRMDDTKAYVIAMCMQQIYLLTGKRIFICSSEPGDAYRLDK
jgi:hypothetical protein